MNEYPILFSGDMVLAILAKRKTQTRRIVKHQPEFGAYVSLEGFDRICLVHEDWAGNGVGVQAFPYARKIRDRLWVKEKCAIGFNDDTDLVVDYHADGKRRWFEVTPENQRYADRYINDDWRRSARFMPHWASRITLEVTGVRAEGLQDISEEDAKAEGVVGLGINEDGYDLGDPNHWIGFKNRFRWLWDSINGKRYPWSENLWVWVIEFKLVEVKS